MGASLEVKRNSFSTPWKWISVASSMLIVILPFALLSAQGGEGDRARSAVGFAASGWGIYRNSWAVVIGINQYTRAPQLNYAVNDARSVVSAVQKLGFPADKILLLLDEEATKQRIEQILYGTLRRTTPEDRVLVFFAGHGVTSSLPRGGEEGFILPVDGDPDDLPLTAIAMADVRQIARRIPAKHILFAVDACYSGFAITREVPPVQVDLAYLQVATRHPAVQIITAGRKDELVMEEEGHGIFTRRMLSGLTGPADIDRNGIITGQELGTWLGERVVQDSENRQHPQYSRLDGEGQFVFIVPGSERPPVLLGLQDRESLQEELKRVSQEAERLKRENVLLEQARKLFEQKQKIDMGKLEAEREILRAESERLAAENARKEEARQEAEARRNKEEQARTELAKLQAEEGRLKAEEELFKKQKAAMEKERAEAEENRKESQSTKATQPSAVAEVQSLPRHETLPKPIPKVVQSPQYRVGDSWTVRFRDGRTATRTVRAVEDDLYVFEWGLDLWQYRDRDFVLRKQITPHDGNEVFSVFLNKTFMDFPLSVGKSWEFRIGNRPRTRTITLTVIGIETIKTPAGSFEAFKIYEESRGGGPITLRYWWYSPEVKFPVELLQIGGDTMSWQEQEYQLIAYDVK